MFPSTYEESRERFRAHLDRVQERWQDVRLESYHLHDHPELSLDWILAQAPRPRRLFLLTTGLHGIEGYVGAAMLDLFVAEFLPYLEPQDTGLILLHAVNPWGMKHRRRPNANNVDLNRNFVTRWEGVHDANPEYERLPAGLSRSRPLGHWTRANIGFYAAVVQALFRLGVKGSREAILRGQHRHPQGLYFGGSEIQEETKVLAGLQEAALTRYEQVIHLDVHSGYGPRNQMSIVNASSEAVSSAECARNFRYPLVVKTNPDEFYTILGDMTEAWYELRNTTHPDKQVYAAALEFGTFGESLPAAIRSLRAVVLENRLYFHGARSPAVAKRVLREFEEAYCPSEPAWREKAVQDARRAFGGILAWFGLIDDAKGRTDVSP